MCVPVHVFVGGVEKTVLGCLLVSVSSPCLSCGLCLYK